MKMKSALSLTFGLRATLPAAKGCEIIRVRTFPRVAQYTPLAYHEARASVKTRIDLRHEECLLPEGKRMCHSPLARAAFTDKSTRPNMTPRSLVVEDIQLVAIRGCRVKLCEQLWC